MPIQIIVRSRHGELARRRVEVARQNLAGYYKEECEKGSRFQSKLSKGTIKKVYEEATDVEAAGAAIKQTRTLSNDDGTSYDQ